jgi:hypothetical protein
MIISGGSRAHWRKFAAHLMKTEGGQQRVAIEEIRGLAAGNLVDAFHEMEALGSGTRATNFYYHVNIDPRADEHMSEEQWEQAIDTLEKNLGLEGHSRFVVEHEKNGRTHRHVVWSRVDTDRMRVVPDEWDYSIHQRTADELEKEFGHEKTPRRREPGQAKGPENWEYFRGKETRINPKEVQSELTALWHQADTPQAFTAALADRDYILCEGERGFCVVDQAGKEHSLYRRVGERKAEVDARMASIEREALPSVAEARKMARDRKQQHQQQGEAQADPSALAHTDPSPSTQHQPSPFHERTAKREEAQPDPAPSPAPVSPTPAGPSTGKRPRSRFGELVEEVFHTIKSAFTRKDVPQLTMGELAPVEEGTAFERTAQTLLRDAREAGPMAGELAAGAALLEGEHLLFAKKEPEAAPASAPEPSEFERVAQQVRAAVRETTGDDELMTAGLDWLARQTKAHRTAAPPPDREPTAFDRMAEETKDAMRENGGQPYTLGEVSFWQRSLQLAAGVAERLAGWVKASWQELVGQFTRGRDPGHDDPGFER